MMKIAGIDYSLTSPAICVYKDENDRHFDFDGCVFHYLSNNEKQRQLAARSGLENIRTEPYDLTAVAAEESVYLNWMPLAPGLANNVEIDRSEEGDVNVMTIDQHKTMLANNHNKKIEGIKYWTGKTLSEVKTNHESQSHNSTRNTEIFITLYNESNWEYVNDDVILYSLSQEIDEKGSQLHRKVSL